MFFFKVLITNAGPCEYFNAISEKHLRYSLFFKRIIAIEAQLYFLGLVRLYKQGQKVDFLFERANILSKKPALKIGSKIKKKLTFLYKP